MSNVLPQGWEESIIENISIKVFSGGTPDTRNELFWNGKFNWLSSGETRNKYIIVTEKKITQDGVENSSTKLALPNDILIASAGQGNTRGQTAFCMIETYFNQSLINIRINIKRAYPKYIFYNISSRYNELRQLSDGHSIRGSLTTKIINKLPIKFPSDINEQKRIADILSAFDDKIELNNQMNQTLEDMATTLFKEWFENFNFPNEQGKPYKDNDGEMKSSELGEIPIDWEVKTLDELLEITSSKRVFRSDYVESGVPFYRSKEVILKSNGQDISDCLYISNEKFEEIKSKYEIPKKGEILLTSVGTLGIPYLIQDEEFYFKDGNLTWFKNFKYKSVNFYIYLWIKYCGGKKSLDEIVIGSTQKALTINALKNIKIIFSEEIIKDFVKRVSIIMEQIQQNQQQNQTLKQQRDTLLPKLMSGEIRV